MFLYSIVIMAFTFHWPQHNNHNDSNKTKLCWLYNWRQDYSINLYSKASPHWLPIHLIPDGTYTRNFTPGAWNFDLPHTTSYFRKRLNLIILPLVGHPNPGTVWFRKLFALASYIVHLSLTSRERQWWQDDDRWWPYSFKWLPLTLINHNLLESTFVLTSWRVLLSHYYYYYFCYILNSVIHLHYRLLKEARETWGSVIHIWNTKSQHTISFWRDVFGMVLGSDIYTLSVCHLTCSN